MNSSPCANATWSLRPMVATDRSAVLRLNADNFPAVYPLDETLLDWLLRFDGYRLVAAGADGEALGYLLAFPSESAYADTEIDQLRSRVPDSFFYICQVVVAREHRRKRIAAAFYDALAKAAQAQGVRALCCDVNIDPPNPDSFAFHHRLGFEEIGSGTASNGFSIGFLLRKL